MNAITVTTVCKVAELTIAQITSLAEQGICSPGPSLDAKGKHRFYSKREVLILGVVAAMKTLGLKTKLLRESANGIAEHSSADDELGTKVVVSDGEDVLLVTAQRLLPIVKDCAKPLLLFPLAPIAQRCRDLSETERAGASPTRSRQARGPQGSPQSALRPPRSHSQSH